MLITGASKGIGKACRNHFFNQYQVITIARTGLVTERGDLTNLNFIRYVVNKHPVVDVLINNVGGGLKGCYAVSFINYIVPCLFMEHYISTMKSGHIINIVSNAAYGAEAYDQGYPKMIANNPDRLWYCASKNALKFASNALARSRLGIKITSIEPGKVDNRGIGLQEPCIQVADIPLVIEWVLAQPFQVNTLHFTPV